MAERLVDDMTMKKWDPGDYHDAYRDDLLKLIEQATGKEAYAGAVPEEGEDAGDDADAIEAEKTMAAA